MNNLSSPCYGATILCLKSSFITNGGKGGQRFGGDGMESYGKLIWRWGRNVLRSWGWTVVVSNRKDSCSGEWVKSCGGVFGACGGEVVKRYRLRAGGGSAKVSG